MSQMIKGKECRFAVYIKPPEWGEPDLHLVKEQITYEDGRIEPSVKLVKNYKRPFGITKKAHQNHNDKKEWEDLDKLNLFESTQSLLHSAIANALEKPYFRGSLRELCGSPYVYGADILSTCCIKKEYMDRYPDTNSPFTISTLDIESDVTGRGHDILMITITFENQVFTAVYKPFVKGIGTFSDRIQDAIQTYLKDYIDLNQWSFNVSLFDDHISLLKAVFNQLHTWKPDLLAIWNIDYDIQEITKLMEKYNLDPKDFFSDPAVPKEYRYFRYKQGKKKKITASGKVTPISPAAQWHTVYTPASFYVIDAMCSYKQIRTGRQEEPSYALDAILNKHLGIRKLKFSQADHLSGLEWHQFLQEQYPIEYIVYNMFDAISMQELDKKTLDLAVMLQMFSGVSDFENFHSQPRRAADNLHYYVLENKNKMIGTTGPNMMTELDDMTLPLSGWVVTLPAHLIHENGLKWVIEDKTLCTNIRVHVADLDIRAAYPTTQVVSNISKETTFRELINIKGINQYTFRMQNINLSSGPTNALEYCQAMFNFPDLNDLEKMYREQSRGSTDEANQAIHSDRAA